MIKFQSYVLMLTIMILTHQKEYQVPLKLSCFPLAGTLQSAPLVSKLMC
jgi:hypothetical protein